MAENQHNKQARRSAKRPFLAMLRANEAPAFLKRMRSNKTGKRNLATKLAEALEEIALGYAFEVDADAMNDRLRDQIAELQNQIKALHEGVMESRKEIAESEKRIETLISSVAASEQGRRADNLKAARTINAIGEINGRAIHGEREGREASQSAKLAQMMGRKRL
jgi:septal ring factor EnvC (AmiA/AmiB activator)